MRWSFFLEMWHKSTAQLLVDGIPQERILLGGIFDVLHIWDMYRKAIVDCKSLPKWTYDPTRDVHRKIVLDKLTDTPLNEPISDQSVGSETCDSEGDDNDNDSLSSHEELGDLEDNDIPYVWPSDAYRYEALASSTSWKTRTPTVQDQKSISENSTIAIDFRISKRIIMGQHQVSTLRVLVRLMRDVHKDILDSGPVTLREKDFWTNLWFRLDNTWGIILPKLLKERFDWVLEYIREGRMPKEALCVKDALRQVWTRPGTVLKSTKHPYSYNVGFVVENVFNPDLCPGWVNAIMSRSLQERSKEAMEY